MIQRLLTPVAAGLLLSLVAASTGAAAAKTDRPELAPLSDIYTQVRERQDFKSMEAVKYDRRERVYHFVYTTDDGDERHVMFDAVSGTQIL